MKKPIPTEYQDQCAVVEYLEKLKDMGKVAIFSALPNNLYTRSWNQKVKQKREGLRAGVPDLIILFDMGEFNQLVFIEMKRQKGGLISKAQKEWHRQIKKAKIPMYVCYGGDEALEVINKHIKK